MKCRLLFTHNLSLQWVVNCCYLIIQSLSWTFLNHTQCFCKLDETDSLKRSDSKNDSFTSQTVLLLSWLIFKESWLLVCINSEVLKYCIKLLWCLFVILEFDGSSAHWLSLYWKEWPAYSSKQERHSYKFGVTWGWVNDDRIVIFGWTIHLKYFQPRAFDEPTSVCLHEPEELSNCFSVGSRCIAFYSFLLHKTIFLPTLKKMIQCSLFLLLY